MMQRIHPLVAAAAVAVILACATGIAAMTGLLPSSSASKSEQALAEAPTDTSKSPAKKVTTTQTTPTSKTSPSTPAADICKQCGRVESVRAVTRQGEANGVGVAAGALIGGLLGNQVGGGDGRTLATIAGAVGGGYTGNEVEKHARATTGYVVDVRMQDGTLRTFPQTSAQFSVGDAVRVQNTTLVRQQS